ncbi:FixJ family two-component response regulator [Rhizobium leguminosarum]|uniref:FixJ family two-component response regulator n=1 Tax=Rhizobium leguminosarum TaxID=384 RepID=A0AAE2MKZ8_RHILE|nr:MULTISPECIES: response regulator [Rhizobium]MBB4291513.1 FixJ family two-component response regulator [Rhizobium leguminosarum]MBB4296210.1 FixJ family two-component response regulator [Rhizobium leguminosarum]MBB4308531.1 FixJ family two-component response regulator [Rhizobium leguminosarum]MBB4416366.1 FixJ family two-component response regulator [Rhizobium leguminosarum]MBB4430667.1 FixJ family two-component response regulator [Rhizobium esperanzae]
MASPLVSIIDDDAGMRTSLDGLIRSLGYRAVCFECAEHFLDSNALQHSACVIADVQMREITGVELCWIVQERYRSQAGVPVILISAFCDERMRASAKAAGAVALLQKPFDGDELVGFIEAAICRSR